MSINKNEDNNTQSDEIFKDNPNLKFKKFLNIQNQLCNEITSMDKFDFFVLNKMAYIAIPDYFCFSSNSLFIFKINPYLNLEKKLTLEGHKTNIVMVKTYFDGNNEQNYIITSDYDYLVIIWKVISEKSIIIKRTIATKYNHEIYSALILFYPKNIFLLTSADTNMCSTEYDFITDEFKKNIPGTKSNKTYYVLNYSDFIIELCLDKIGIYNLSEDNNNICEFISQDIKGDNRHGNIINNILFVSNSNGNIILIDLIQKNIKHIINSSNSNFFSLIEWNSLYLIVSDINKNRLNIIDTKQKKIINRFFVKTNPLYIKKIKLNKSVYKTDDILLILGNKMFFELWKKINN